jgi:hypothetical protein
VHDVIAATTHHGEIGSVWNCADNIVAKLAETLGKG